RPTPFRNSPRHWRQVAGGQACAVVLGRKTFETVLAFDAWPYGEKPFSFSALSPLAAAPPRRHSRPPNRKIFHNSRDILGRPQRKGFPLKTAAVCTVLGVFMALGVAIAQPKS